MVVFMVKKSAAGGHGSDEIDDLMILSRRLYA